MQPRLDVAHAGDEPGGEAQSDAGELARAERRDSASQPAREAVAHESEIGCGAHCMS